MALPESSIVEIIIRERISVLAYVNSILHDAHKAEDCFQEVLTQAITRKAEFDDETHVIRWTLAASRNKAIDVIRKKQRQPLQLEEDVLELVEAQWTQKLTGNEDNGHAQTRALSYCLQELTENNRRIVELRYFDGLKSAAVADALGRSVDSIYKALTRIHSTLRGCVERRLPLEQGGALK